MQTQHAFTAYIRHPDTQPVPTDVKEHRMQIYSELFYNNVEDFMSTTYPVLKEILGEYRWHNLLRDYFANHKARTPIFPEMPREFLIYLEEERKPKKNDYPFIFELAHYEWIELVLSISELTNETENLSTQVDFLNGVPVLSNLAWLLSYQFPVQHISIDFLPGKADTQPTHIVASRLIDEEDVIFTEVNSVIARLLQLISNNSQQLTGKQLLTKIAAELGNTNIDNIIEFGHQTLSNLHNKNIVIGTLCKQ